MKIKQKNHPRLAVVSLILLSTFFGKPNKAYSHSSIAFQSSKKGPEVSGKMVFSPADNQSSTDSIFSLITIGDPCNAPDDQGRGAVEKIYQIGKYEVTARQYAGFLNAVAWKEDPHGLYHSEMGSDKKVACIQRGINDDGTYRYDLIDDQRGDLPITYVTLNDAERFCNWLENGLPGRDQDYQFLQQSTESGAYIFSQQDNQMFAEANPNAHYHLPSDDEWMKAAYYNGGGASARYWLYPTQHDTAPSAGAGDVTNFANYQTYQGNVRDNFLDAFLMITAVNCFDKTETFYQACDMGGNVAEWTIPTGSSGPALARGGSWQSIYSWYGHNELMRTTLPKGYDPSTATNFIGFRIAATVDPTFLGNQNQSSFEPSQTVATDGTASAASSKILSNDEVFLGKMLFTGGVLLASSLLFIGAEIALGILVPEVSLPIAGAVLEGDCVDELAVVEAEMMPSLAPATGMYDSFLKTLSAFPPRRILVMGVHLLINAYAVTKSAQIKG